MQIVINSIDYNGSLVNGYGVRTLIFLQGCNLCCEGCHNKCAWDISRSTPWEIEKLTKELNDKVKNKKITITGGVVNHK
jgi:organic radical activating enzyme